MRYFELDDKLDCAFPAFVARGTNIRRPGGCVECSTVPKNGSPPDILRIKGFVARAIVSHTSWGFGVVATEFLDLLGSDASKSLRLGRLANSDGDILDGFRTHVGIDRLFLRGNRDSLHRVCNSCGAMLYTYLPRESPYVTTAQVASGRPIYENESMQLVVDESIRNRIGNRWPNALQIREVPVVDAPLDGLPPDLGFWPAKSQLADYHPNLSQMKNERG